MSKLVQIQYDMNCYDTYDPQTCLNPNWHELRQQEKWSSLAPPNKTFMLTIFEYRGFIFTYLLKMYNFVNVHEDRQLMQSVLISNF